MRFRAKWLSVVIPVIAMFPSIGHSASLLDQELEELDALRNGFKTPFDKVDEKAADLLSRYEMPEDLGQIYYGLAHVDGQSGIQRPDKLVAYVQQALSYPQDPVRRMNLYMYWGNAIEIGNRGARGAELAAARKEASAIYMQAITESLLEQKRAAVEMEKPPEAIPTSASPLADNRVLGAERLRQSRLGRLIKTMGGKQELHQKQIVYLYTKFPFATEELRSMATEIIGDSDVVKDLMDRVEAGINERLKKEVPKETADFVRDVDLVKIEIEKSVPAKRPVETPAALAAIPKANDPDPTRAAPSEKPQGNVGSILIAGICLGAALLAGAVFFFLRKVK